MQWLSHFDLDSGVMDATHREFVALVSRLETCEDNEFAGLFQELIEHTANHFEQENQWMEQCAFPPIFIHREEHERVLTNLREAAAELEEGDVSAGRDAVAVLPDWFDMHAQTMDRALASHMRRSGFEPSAEPHQAA